MIDAYLLKSLEAQLGLQVMFSESLPTPPLSLRDFSPAVVATQEPLCLQQEFEDSHVWLREVRDERETKIGNKKLYI